MKQGGYRRAGVFSLNDSASRSGFTVVEVLIVLAVSGFMFIAAATLINGRQNRTQFATAINNAQQRLQQIINETVSGYYPNSGTFTCSGSSSPVTFTSATGTQGTNSGCIFMGKALQFGLSSNSSGIGILPLVGNQYSSGDPVLTVAQAAPRAIYPATGEVPFVPPNVALTDFLENGLTVASSSGSCPTTGMCYAPLSGSPIATGVVAFVAGDSAGNIAGSSNGNLQSGAQQLSLYGVTGSTVNKSLGDASLYVGDNSVPGHTASGLVAASKVYICLASATTNQSGLLTIDGGLHVALDIKNGVTC